VLREDHEKIHQQQREDGVDYRSAQQRNVWPLTSFVGKLAKLLGRRGGISDMRPEEMEILAAFHQQHDRLHEGLLEQAFERAQASVASPTLPEVLLQLQLLLENSV
jgi:hypothetical protein